MLTKKACGPCDVINVDTGISTERETLIAVKRRKTYTPHYGRTASGYGSKLPTCYMLHVGNRWRRVYAICWSNVSTYYIIKNGERIVINW